MASWDTLQKTPDGPPNAAVQKKSNPISGAQPEYSQGVNPAPVVLVRGPEEYMAIRAMDPIRARLRAAHARFRSHLNLESGCSW